MSQFHSSVWIISRAFLIVENLCIDDYTHSIRNPSFFPLKMNYFYQNSKSSKGLFSAFQPFLVMWRTAVYATRMYGGGSGLRQTTLPYSTRFCSVFFFLFQNHHFRIYIHYS
ncbi:MAG: hypothetical protein HC892_22050 [Saprospiraceae bacterium]|nr:hypothetical protein [Saprospiraceae bacterium]